MPSSVIRAYFYDAARQQLNVVFTTGRRFSYNGVPTTLFEDMKAAFSKGEFVNAYIRDGFAYTWEE